MTQSLAVEPPAATGQPSVSVIICAFTLRRWPDIVRAVASIDRQTVHPLEILLVIDHNAELRALAEQRLTGVTVLSNTGSKGLSGARNSGIAASKGDVIAFLDDDAAAVPTWLETLLSSLGDDRVLGVGGAAAPVWPSDRPGWWPPEFDWVVGCAYRGLPDFRGPVRNIMGCSMAFRREAFDHGGFAEALGRVDDIPLGCEETELCIRASLARPGDIFLYEPRAVVHHTVAPERVTPRYFLRRCLAEGRSKARMATLVGSAEGLSSERSYVAVTLPTGVLRAVGDVLRGDGAAALRAVMIVAGLSATVLGYLHDRVAGRGMSHLTEKTGGRRAAEQAFRPLGIIQVELTAPLPTSEHWQTASDSRSIYSRSRMLVRLAGIPLGVLDVDADETVEQTAERLWDEFGPRINQELVAVGAAPVGQLSVGGLSPVPSRQADALPPVSVVVATHDRPAQLRRCLDSLIRCQPPAAQIIVVDSAPSDDAAQHIIARAYPDVVYVRETDPGLALAHNRALPVIEAPFVAFTDDDVVVDSAWVGAIAGAFAADPSVGCVTGLILPAELETAAQWWIERHGGFGKGFTRRRFDLAQPPEDEPLFPYAAGAFGSGANMAFETQLLRELGGFDAALGAGSPGVGGDDLAGFVDVLRAGRVLVYQPTAIVHHWHDRERAGVTRQVRNYGTGFTAFLTRLVVADPTVALRLLWRLPAALAHVRRIRLQPVTPDGIFNPRTLLAMEVVGLLTGPLAYFRGRRWAKTRRHVPSTRED